MKWLTFYGCGIEISELSHQHLSNILWYYELIVGDKPSYLIQLEINTRFGGIRHPYKPLHSFKEEIDTLYSLGYITNKHESDVVVNGKWVGKLSYA